MINKILKFLFLILIFNTKINATIFTDNLSAGSSGNWSSPSSWLPVGVPNIGDTVIILNGFIVVDIIDRSVKHLTIQNTGRLKTDRKLTITNHFFFKGGNTYGDSTIVSMDSTTFSGGNKIIRNKIIMNGKSNWTAGNINFTADPDGTGSLVHSPDAGGKLIVMDSLDVIWNNVTTNLLLTNDRTIPISVEDNAVMRIFGAGIIKGVGEQFPVTTTTVTGIVAKECRNGPSNENCGNPGGGNGGIDSGEDNPDPLPPNPPPGTGCNSGETGASNQKTTPFYGKMIIKDRAFIKLSGGIDFMPGSSVEGQGRIQFKKALVSFMGIASNFSIDSMSITNKSIVKGNGHITSKKLNINLSAVRDSVNITVDSLVQENSFMSGFGQTIVSETFELKGTMGNTINRIVKNMGAAKWTSAKTSFSLKGKIMSETGSTLDIITNGNNLEYSRGKGPTIDMYPGAILNIKANEPSSANRSSLVGGAFNHTSPGYGGITTQPGSIAAINQDTKGDGGGGSGGGGGTTPGTCTDGRKNQGETGVDCGGPCTPCGSGSAGGSGTCDTDTTATPPGLQQGIWDIGDGSELYFDSGSNGFGSGGGTSGGGGVVVSGFGRVGIMAGSTVENTKIDVKDNGELIYQICTNLPQDLFIGQNAIVRIDSNCNNINLINISASGKLFGSGNLIVKEFQMNGGRVSGPGSIAVSKKLILNNSAIVEKVLIVDSTGIIVATSLFQNLNFQSFSTAPRGKIIVNEDDELEINCSSFGYGITSTITNTGHEAILVKGKVKKVGFQDFTLQNNHFMRTDVNGLINCYDGLLINQGPTMDTVFHKGKIGIDPSGTMEFRKGTHIFLASANIFTIGTSSNPGNFIVSGNANVTLQNSISGCRLKELRLQGGQFTTYRLTAPNKLIVNGGNHIFSMPSNGIIDTFIQSNSAIFTINGLMSAEYFKCTSGSILGSGELRIRSKADLSNFTLGALLTVNDFTTTSGYKATLKGNINKSGTGKIVLNSGTFSLLDPSVNVACDLEILDANLDVNPALNSNTASITGKLKMNTSTINLLGGKGLNISGSGIIHNISNSTFSGTGQINITNGIAKFIGDNTISSDFRFGPNSTLQDNTNTGLNFINLLIDQGTMAGPSNTKVLNKSYWKNTCFISKGTGNKFTIASTAQDTIDGSNTLGAIELQDNTIYEMKGTTTWLNGILKIGEIGGIFLITPEGTFLQPSIGNSFEILAPILVQGTFIKNKNNILKFGNAFSQISELVMDGGTVNVNAGDLQILSGDRNYNSGTINIASNAKLTFINGTHYIESGMSILGDGFMRANSGRIIFENGSIFSARLACNSHLFNSGVINNTILTPKELRVEKGGGQFAEFINNNNTIVSGKFTIGDAAIVTGTDTITVMDSMLIVSPVPTAAASLSGIVLVAKGGIEWRNNDFKTRTTDWTYTNPYPPNNTIAVSNNADSKLIVDSCAMIFNASIDKSIDIPIRFNSATLTKINTNKNIVKAQTAMYGPTEFNLNAGTLEINTSSSVIHHWSKNTAMNFGGGVLRFVPGLQVVFDND
jgi:hypothetical protein